MKTGKKLMILLCVILALACLCGTASAAAPAENGAAGTARLLHLEGAAEILDAAGEPRTPTDDGRLESGETLCTGEDGIAAVSLEDGRTAILDRDSRAVFEMREGAVLLTLEEGTLLLDVEKKLGEDETLDLRTSAATVGIRGTIVFLTAQPAADGPGTATTLGVLEGVAEMEYTDKEGTRRTLDVTAGQKATLEDAGGPATAPLVTPLTREDLPAILENVPAELPDIANRIENAVERIPGGDYSADGDWTWSGTVTLAAQSASKIYDGTPLTRPTDVLVDGLPAGLRIEVSAVGSQTDAGTSANVVGAYTITNARGEDVTGHFADIRTVSGQLTVDPAPLTVWTGSASKPYDGKPLTSSFAELTAVSGHDWNAAPWRNLAYAGNGAAGPETLYGLCGTTWVHGTNPLTGEIREIELSAGKKMTVVLSDEAGASSIKFIIEDLTEEDLPEEVLRIYAQNPELLAQACKDTGWDEKLLTERIGQLSGEKPDLTRKMDLTLPVGAKDRLMADCTDVRIRVDSEITSYNGRPLGDEEVSFTPVSVPAGIKVTATGSQTEVGWSNNTYTINWGSSKPNNYILNEALGVLSVTAPLDPISLTAASADKVYDGTPLTAEECTVSGLPEGFSVSATVAGSQTDAGSSANIITAYTILDSDGADVTAAFTDVTLTEGTLTVVPAPLTAATGSAEKVYDGTPLVCEDATLEGLVNGETATAAGTGSLTHAGTAENGCGITWGTAKAENYIVTTIPGTLTVTPLALGFDIDAEDRVYDGSTVTPAGATATYLNGSHAGETVNGIRTRGLEAAYVFRLFTGEEAALTVSGGGSDAGTYTLTAAAGVEDNDTDYAIVLPEALTVTVSPAPLTVTGASAQKPYDGTPLTAGATVEGLVNGESVTAAGTGSLTDVGTAKNGCRISWGSTNPSNYSVTVKAGTLKVTALPVRFSLGGHTAEYNGDAQLVQLSSPDAELLSLGSLTDSMEHEVGVTATFRIPGGEVRLNCNCFTDAGSYTLSAGTEMLSGKAANYSFRYTDTAMTITPMNVTVRLHDGSTLPYNGEVQLGNFSACNASFDIGFFYEGKRGMTWGSDRIFVNVSGGGKTPGTYTLSCVYVPEAGVKLSNYHFTVTGTSLTIGRAALTIQTPSASKPYDGAALTASPATVTGLSSADAARVTVTCTGTITSAGTAQNSYTIDWGGVDSSNYTVTEELGTLKVHKRHFSFTVYANTGSSSNQTVPYKGSWYSLTYSWSENDDDGKWINPSFNYSYTSTVNTDKGTFRYPWGDEFVLSTTGGGIDPGEYPTTGSVSFNSGDPSNYVFDFTLTTLTITPAPLTIWTGSAEKLFDGSPLTNPAGGADGLVGGDRGRVTVTGTGSITDVGWTTNTCDISWNGVNSNNYAITQNLGTLTVTQVQEESNWVQLAPGREIYILLDGTVMAWNGGEYRVTNYQYLQQFCAENQPSQMTDTQLVESMIGLGVIDHL